MSHVAVVIVCAVIACQEKAKYLLKFSGVSRESVRTDGGQRSGSVGSRAGGKASKNKNWTKISAVVNAVERMKQVSVCPSVPH